MIKLTNISKEFKEGIQAKRIKAIDDLGLEVQKGEVFGFLGPNGAGKSTTIKILVNLIRPDKGKALIMDRDVNDTAVRKHVGYLPENPYFYDYLTAEELLLYIGKLFGIRQPALGNKVAALLDNVGLGDSRKLQLRKFSKGMIQRIGLAQAMINDPEVIFLDEPMSGLDPLGRREARQAILALKKKGVTVFFSSHILPDVEALCDRVAILNRGRLQQVGALHDILKVKIEAHEIVLTGVGPESAAGLKPLCDEMTPMGDRLQLRAGNPQQVESIISYALAHGVSLVSVNPIRSSLEDHFFQEIGARR